MQRQNCVLVKKCLEKRLNSVTFNDYFKNFNQIKSTRNKKFLVRLLAVKLEIAKQGLYFGGAKLYNSLPLELRSETDLSKFRSKLNVFKFL